ncbi:MAG: hypothetical protein AABW73_04490 [Nanoarchaeota archaeon]
MVKYTDEYWSTIDCSFMTFLQKYPRATQKKARDYGFQNIIDKKYGGINNAKLAAGVKVSKFSPKDEDYWLTRRIAFCEYLLDKPSATQRRARRAGFGDVLDKFYDGINQAKEGFGIPKEKWHFRGEGLSKGRNKKDLTEKLELAT